MKGMAMFGGMKPFVGAATGASATAISQYVRQLVLGGPIASVDSEYFKRLVSKHRGELLVVHAVAGIFSKTHVYATNYKGFTFVTKTKEPLPITPDMEAKSIWLPLSP